MEKTKITLLSSLNVMAMLLLIGMIGGANVFAQTVVVNQTALSSGTYTVPYTGQVTIVIRGADGGNGSNTTGGRGAQATATFSVTAGDIIRYVVGEVGQPNAGSSAGGGASTGVLINGTIVMVAGGGGGGDNSGGAIGLGGNAGTAGDAGTGTGPGAAGTNGNGGGATTNTSAAGGGGGINSAGGSGAAGGGARADATFNDPQVLLDIANGGTGNGSGSRGGNGFTGGGGAGSNYSGGGGGYSGGGGAGANGSAGGGGSYIHTSGTATSFTAGGDGAGTQSDGSITVTLIDNTPPPAPQNVAAIPVSINSIQVSFSDVNESGSGVSSYSIRRSTTSGSGYTQIGTVTDNNSTSYTYSDNTASPNTTYYYVVRAIDAVGNESANSAQSSATIDGVAPVLQSAAVNGASLVLDYNESLNAASVPATGAFSVLVGGIQRAVTNVAIAGDLVTLTLASAVNQGESVSVSYTPGANPVEDTIGNDAASFSGQPVTNNTITVIPAPPIEIEATATSGGVIAITFEDVDSQIGIASYNIKRSTSQGGPYSTIGTVTDNESINYLYNDNTGVDGTTYYYIITSVNQNTDEGSNSEEVSATADATAPVRQLITVNGEYVSIDYNEQMDNGSVPSINDFTVLVNGGTRTVIDVTVVGQRVILSLDPEVQAGDNVVLTYAQGTNVIQDAAGNTAAVFSSQQVTNTTYGTQSFGPDPCPIVNGQDVAWSCFSGIYNGTSMSASVGGLVIGNVAAATGSATTFAPNALQQWASGAFSGDQYNGPQANPSGAAGNTTSFDINIPANVPSNALVLALNRLRPAGGGTSYTLEAYDASNNKLQIDDWITGQGTDGGVCTNPVTLNYTNGNTTIEFQPVVSGNPSCTSSSTPVWFRITDANVSRIELRKVTGNADNIHFGLGITADFGDAPATYGTRYSGSGTPPAFHLLNNGTPNLVYLGSVVDGDGNGAPGATANGDDSESAGIGNGDDEDAVSSLQAINSAQTSVQITLACTTGGYVGGWIDFDLSGTFDVDEFATGVCSGGSVTLTWNGINGMVEGNSVARFRIASNQQEVSSPTGVAMDGEVEDYIIVIEEPPAPDLEISKTVDVTNPVEEDNVIFTVTVKNPSDFDATGVRVTDQLPSGLSFLTAVASQGSYNAQTGIWNIGTIAAGDTTGIYLTITAKVDDNTLGNTITNIATISQLDQTDPELNNNSASAGITVVPESADIAITKTVTNNAPIEGEFISYTVTVNNNGPKAAQNLKIIDQLPTGILFISANASIGTYTQSTGIWNIGNLQNGASATLDLNVRIDDNTEGTAITNTANLNTMTQVDPVSSNNTASVVVNIASPTANLSCPATFANFTNAVLVSGTALQTGALYRYTNVLPGVNAEVRILTMNNVNLLQLDAPGTQSGVGSDAEFAPYIRNANGGSGFIDFEISFFDANTGLSKYLTFSATTGDVDGTGDLRDYVGYQNLNSFVVENTTTLIAGTSGIYATFMSQNYQNTIPGASDFTNYKVYTTYTNEKSFKVRAGIDANQTVGSRIISINFDPCELNTFANPVTNPVVDVAVLKTVDDSSVEVGQQVTYTVKAQNKKAAAVGGIQITDQLPTGLNFVSANPSQGSYNQTSGLWTVGSLSGFQEATLQLVATVNTGTEGNTITNTANLTAVTGTDGLGTNNTATASILVFNPQSGLNCNEPPLYSFLNYSLEQGVTGQLNSVYRFTSIGNGVDALVKIVAINNATVDDIDANNIQGQAVATNFSPLFTKTNGSAFGYIDWDITLVQTGTNTPIKSNFSVTGVDIDGNTVNGNTIRDYYGFAENNSSVIESSVAGGNLTGSFQSDFEIWESAVATDGNGAFDKDHIVYITYKYTSKFRLRTGSFATNGYSAQRLVAFNFTQCLNQEFTNPVVSTRDADLQILKTVDEANPLENETINFTINVSNTGPEKATEVVVNEALPTGLTLVEAAPSQGTYNQITKLWSVGTLLNGASASLAIEATVDEGLQADSLINKAFIDGFNQNDPTVASDTSSVVLRIGAELKGIVFQDITGNGVSEDMVFNDASGDQQALENVEVHLFRDGGDGLADGTDDVFLSTKNSSNLGEYSFKIGEDADYWIVVDSKTGELSNGNYWGEQTYAPLGALCEDGNGNTAVLTAAGNCFGGRRGGVSDNIAATPTPSDLANAEHIAKVTMAGSEVAGINFGFSYNVVTHPGDLDDDATSNRSSQGSLRQFITNANEISGANTMRFVPSVVSNASGSGGNWWSVTLNSELPVITDPLTTIGGTAYFYNAPKSVRDTNTGNAGTNGTVGIDNISLPAFPRKEFEINLNDVGSNALNVNSSGAYTIRNVAVYNGTNGIRITASNNGVIEKNFIGTRADGTDPSGANRLDTGILFDGGSAVNPTIQQNYMAFLNASAVQSTNQNSTITFINNEIYQAAQSSTTADGIEGIGTWSIRQNIIHGVGNGSSNPVNGGNGIELGSGAGSSPGNTIRNNSIFNNAVAGIAITNAVTNSLVEKNKIYQNGSNYSSGTPKLGAGIKLANPSGTAQQGIRITRNSFYNNYGISIDLVTGGTGQSDGVSPNDGVLVSSTSTPNRGLDYPVFSLATLENGVLHVEGYVGTSTTKLQQTYTIEVYKADDDGDSDAVIEVGGSLIRAHGEGKDLIGVITTNSNGTFSTDIPVPGGVSLAFNDRITATTTSSVNNTSEFSANHRVVPTGVTISGYVYHDENHNQNRDGNEPGLQSVTIVMYNTQQNNCKSVLTDANGFYQFTNVLNGTYDLIESFGQSVPTPDICTPAEVDPDDYISTTPNLRTVSVNNLPAIQDFGDYEGSKITGTIYNDNGIGGGTANDAIKNGGELGISTQLVKALTAADVLIEQTSTAADGSYALYVPKAVVGDGGTIKIQEVNGGSYLSTGGNAGTTSGSYTIATDVTEFINLVGSIYTGVNFADVIISALYTDGVQTTQPGAVAVFTHLFDANTAGDVTFTINSVNNPNINFPAILNHDLNCSGGFDSGEPVLTSSTVINVNAGDNICLVLRVTVPNGVDDGGTSTTTVTATFDYSNSPTNIQQVLQRTDIITVNSQSGGLVIIKAVDKAQALPGDTLTYTIDYQNLGDEPISQVEVVDEIPVYTTFQSSNCGILPSGVTNCTLSAPVIGGTGTIRWNLTGVLQPGDSGTVSYKVLIDN